MPGLYLPPPQTVPRQADPGHGHHGDSDDPLAWLRESIPGKEIGIGIHSYIGIKVTRIPIPQTDIRQWSLSLTFLTFDRHQILVKAV